MASISAPVVKHVAFLTAKSAHHTFRYGAWGWCDTLGANVCTGRSVGYPLAEQASAFSGQNIAHSVSTTTRALVMHPIACVLAFIAFVICATADRFGFLGATMFTSLAFVFSFIVMVIDFALFGRAKRNLNKTPGIHAQYGSATWLTLVATLCLFFALFFTFFSCCVGRRDNTRGHVESGHVTTEKRGLFGNKHHRHVDGVAAPGTTTVNNDRRFWKR